MGCELQKISNGDSLLPSLMDTFAKRLKRIRTDRGVQSKDLARQVGVTAPMVSRWERQGVIPETKTVHKIAAALGVPVTALIPLEATLTESEQGAALPRGFEVHSSWPGSSAETPTGAAFVSVPLMDGRIAAGQPLVVDDIEIADYIAFPKSLLDQLGVTKPRCVRAGRQERSMFPTIYPDAIVLLDCADSKRQRPRNGRIYAVNVDYGSTLKRVTVAGGVVFLSSDNADKLEYPMIEIRQEDHDEHAELPRIIVGEAVLSINILQ